MKKLSLVLLLAFVVSILPMAAQSVLGKWKTIDDETGKAKSVVELYMKGDKLYGKIVQLLNRAPGDEDPICDVCPGDRKNKKTNGMEIIRDMEKDGSEWEDGEILDPSNGKLYDCKLWVDEDNSNILNVRGYIAFFFRTQTWHRVK